MRDLAKEICFGLMMALYMAGFGLCLYSVIYGVNHPELSETQFVMASLGRVGAAGVCALLGFGLSLLWGEL
jgi:hypothetical protein